MQDDLIERWGFEWKGHDHGTHVRMADGYWTPWHIAANRIAALETTVVALSAAAQMRLDMVKALEAKLAEKDALLRECGEALAPFAECAEQIVSIEDDEEWAKFRLLIKDYRLARTTLAKIKDATDAD